MKKEVADGDELPGTEQQGKTTLAGNINEYLHTMKLGGLSEQEVEHLAQITNLAPQLFVEGPPGTGSRLPSQAHMGSGGQPQSPEDSELTAKQARCYSSKKHLKSFGLDFVKP